MKTILVLLTALSGIISFSNEELRQRAMFLHEDPVIEWSDFETAIDKNADKKKLIFIDMYTDWCGWCKKMDQTTFQDHDVVTYMNEHFHAVKMNPESPEAVVFREKLYELKDYNGKKYNELAVNLLGGKMSFPSFIILSKKEVKIGTISGYQSPTQLLSALDKYVK